MSDMVRPSLLAIVQAAVDGTGAGSGWLLLASDEHLEVVAAIGAEGASDDIGATRPHQGAAGYALASGQPAALQVRPDDADNFGAGNSPGAPGSLLASPCSDGEVVGVLELADAPGGRFSFDDVETIALLSDIAGALLSETTGTIDPTPSPAELAASFATLARNDPGRYAAFARAVGALL